MTKMLAERLKKLDVVDANSCFLEKTKERNLHNINFIESLFEEYILRNEDEKYDYVFANYIFEHVLDVQVILNMIKNVIKQTGLLFIVVPNARALSRQLALHMGLLDDLKQLTKNDVLHGYRRVFDRAALNKEIKLGGLKNISQGGIMLKILANYQMDKLIDEGILNDSQIEGLYSLGLEYPDFCGSIFSIGKVV
jgi:2-polyprenyl-3-methyl-5-hydroxy-6-metoxy-1,4-benzoquinol methylase